MLESFGSDHDNPHCPDPDSHSGGENFQKKSFKLTGRNFPDSRRNKKTSATKPFCEPQT